MYSIVEPRGRCMKKIIPVIIILCILILVCLCVKDLNNSKEYVSKGINVSGPEDCYEFNPSNGKQVLHIKSDGAVITGDAQADTYILIAETVSSVEIDELNQGQYKIFVESENNMTPPLDLEVKFSGTNCICLVEWFEKLRINGKEADANLLVSSGIHLTKELALSDGKLQTGYIIVPEEIIIKGNTQLYLNTVEHQLLNDNLWAARIDSNKLLIDLDEGGEVIIKDCY